MKKYSKPVADVVKSVAEGVYMSSGQKVTCRYGRTEANAGSDTCQGCSATGGASSDGSGYFDSDFVGCPDNMPIK